MPYQSSKRPACLDCGVITSHPSAKRCRTCSTAHRNKYGLWKTPAKPRQFNDYRIENDVAYIELRNSANVVVAETMIDEADLPLVSTRRWYLANEYAGSTDTINGKSIRILMHRVVLGLPSEGIRGSHVDHINHNPLDNRRENLRVVDALINAGNRVTGVASRYPGVTWHSRFDRWAAQIRVDGVTHFLGRFEREEEAFDVYQRARERFGLPPVNVEDEHRNWDGVERLGRAIRPYTSRYYGVARCKQTGRWRVLCEHKGERAWLGRYDTEAEAAAVAAAWRRERGLPVMRPDYLSDAS